MRSISERVTIERTPERTSVVVSARLPKGKEALLVTWTIAWFLCGIYVIYARTELAENDPLRQYLLAFLAFWAYFAFKIGRVVLWRMKGFELWLIKDGSLTVKDSIFGYGKATNYFIENIQKMGLLKIEETSIKWQLNDSPWVMGGERLGFEYVGKKVIFGKGLTEEEARNVLSALKQALTEERKRA